MNRKGILRILVATILVLLAVVFVANSASAETYRWVIGRGHPAVSKHMKLMMDWFPAEVSKRVKAATGDDIKWVKAAGGSIAKVGDELEAMGSGLLTFSLLMPMFETSKVPELSYSYQAPFGTSDVNLATEIGHRIYTEIPAVEEKLTKLNIKYLGAVADDGYQLITKFPVRKVADIENKKIAGAGPNLVWIKSGGAIPVQSNLVEAYSAMQTGVYEGWIMFTNLSKGFKFHEVCKYQANTGFGVAAVYAMAMNLDAYNSLPPVVQRILLNVGREHGTLFAQSVTEAVAESERVMKDAGVTFYDFPESERTKWANQLPNIPQQYVDGLEAKGIKSAKEIMSFWLDAQREAGYKFPRNWTVE